MVKKFETLFQIPFFTIVFMLEKTPYITDTEIKEHRKYTNFQYIPLYFSTINCESKCNTCGGSGWVEVERTDYVIGKDGKLVPVKTTFSDPCPNCNG
jgi:hypothetical protein